MNLNGREIQLYRAKTKTAFKIPVYPQLRPLLECLCAARSSAPHDEKLFAVVDPKKALAAACARLVLPSLSPRSLRRMFIIRVLKTGAQVKTVSQWQGHSDGGRLVLSTCSETINQVFCHSEAELMK